MEVQVELADHLTVAAVFNAVQGDVRVPDRCPIHQLEAQAQQLLVDVQQPAGHHLHGEVLLQQVLVHRVLSLLHLEGGESVDAGESGTNKGNRLQTSTAPVPLTWVMK